MEREAIADAKFYETHPPKCNCNHLLKNHVIDIKKTMKNEYVVGKCKFCKCKEISLQ